MGGMQHDEHLRRHAPGPEIIMKHDRIRRGVTNLPDGIKTVTESEDPQVAQAIKAHVASMEQRLKDGREFNMFSPTLPVLFENKDKIKTVVERRKRVHRDANPSERGRCAQAHAMEVSELARDGMVAMMRSARASMGMMPRGPRAGTRPSTSPAPQAPPANEHVH
jgi:hypothetical protein